MSRSHTDVLVLGAGAAGLAAARELSQVGFSATIIEARNRIGGRFLTLRDPYSPAPIELGAEFIHGEAEDTLRIVRAAYVYVGAGGLAAQKALAKPIGKTLFFAGEATDPEQTGTVAGAIASGRRAARELIQTLNR